MLPGWGCPLSLAQALALSSPRGLRGQVQDGTECPCPPQAGASSEGPAAPSLETQRPCSHRSTPLAFLGWRSALRATQGHGTRAEGRQVWGGTAILGTACTSLNKWSGLGEPQGTNRTQDSQRKGRMESLGPGEGRPGPSPGVGAASVGALLFRLHLT